MHSLRDIALPERRNPVWVNRAGLPLSSGLPVYPGFGHVVALRRLTRWAMCGRLRVGKGFLYACGGSRSSHVFGLSARFT